MVTNRTCAHRKHIRKKLSNLLIEGRKTVWFIHSFIFIFKCGNHAIRTWQTLPNYICDKCQPVDSFIFVLINLIILISSSSSNKRKNPIFVLDYNHCSICIKECIIYRYVDLFSSPFGSMKRWPYLWGQVWCSFSILKYQCQSMTSNEIDRTWVERKLNYWCNESLWVCRRQLTYGTNNNSRHTQTWMPPIDSS